MKIARRSVPERKKMRQAPRRKMIEYARSCSGETDVEVARAPEPGAPAAAEDKDVAVNCCAFEAEPEEDLCKGSCDYKADMFIINTSKLSRAAHVIQANRTLSPPPSPFWLASRAESSSLR